MFDADDAAAAGVDGRDVILVRPETTADDIHGLIAAKGVLTARGGMTSHAAVVARGRDIAEVSLNFAAFARLLHSPRGPIERLLGHLLVYADSFFQIERLYRFNEKFNPRWEARYLMHEGALNLPRTVLSALWIEGQLPRTRFRRGTRAETTKTE